MFHWLKCIQFCASSRFLFCFRSSSISCAAEAENGETPRSSRRSLESSRKLRRTEMVDCAIAGHRDSLCKACARMTPVSEVSSNQGPSSRAETVPLRVDEDRIRGERRNLCNSSEIAKVPFANHPWTRARQLCTVGKGDLSVFCTKKEAYLGVCQATKLVDSPGESLYCTRLATCHGQMVVSPRAGEAPVKPIDVWADQTQNRASLLAHMPCTHVLSTLI